MIYLDHAAATPVDERVLGAMMPYFGVDFFNPSSPYLPAKKVAADYEKAKSVIAHSVGAKSSDLVVTAGATEANNLAFTSLGIDMRGQGLTEPVFSDAGLENLAFTTLGSDTKPDISRHASSRPSLRGSSLTRSPLVAKCLELSDSVFKHSSVLAVKFKSSFEISAKTGTNPAAFIASYTA